MESKHNFDKISAAGILIAFGIIYGDIGTSPLYVMQAIIGKEVITDEIIYGALSCIVWTLDFTNDRKIRNPDPSRR